MLPQKASIVTSLVLASCLHYTANAFQVTGPRVITATQLAKLRMNGLALRKYVGEWTEVQGAIFGSVVIIGNNVWLRFGDNPIMAKKGLGDMGCNLSEDRSGQSLAADLTPGDRITIRGFVSNDDGDINLNRCVFIEKGK